MTRFRFIFSFSVLLLLSSSQLIAQSISGQLTNQPNTFFKLIGHDGFKSTVIDSTTSDRDGNFRLKKGDYSGMVTISDKSEANISIIVVDSDISFSGSTLADFQNIRILESEENNILEEYSIEHAERETALAGWMYLQRNYVGSESLSQQKKTLKSIAKEIKRIQKVDTKYLSDINPNLYAAWYLPKRKLISEIPATLNHYPARLNQHIVDFHKIDFTDKQMKTSGLLSNLLEAYTWMLESYGSTLDSAYNEINRTTDHILTQLEGDSELYNSMGLHLLKLYEKRSLFPCAEYISLKLLSNDACSVDQKLSDRAELYRLMKVGNQTPEITLPKTQYRNGKTVNEGTTLSSLQNKYTLLVFGASWCQKCQEELFALTKLYPEWKKLGLEIIFISLDEDPQTFASFSNIFPWLSVSDFDGWESSIVKDYHVFGSPTLFLLDQNRTIVDRIYTVEQLKGVVKYKLR